MALWGQAVLAQNILTTSNLMKTTYENSLKVKGNSTDWITFSASKQYIAKALTK